MDRLALSRWCVSCRNAVWQTGTGRGGAVAGLLLGRLVEFDVLWFVVNLRRTRVLYLTGVELRIKLFASCCCFSTGLAC